MEDEDRTKRKVNKWTMIGFITLGVVVILLLIVPIVISGLGGGMLAHEDDGGESEVSEELAFTQFENEYQLEYGVGKTTAKKIFSQINRIVSSPEEYGDASERVFTATLVETSFRKVNIETGYAYYFDLDISDGRKYQVYAVVDVMYGNGYYGCLIRRTESVTDTAYFELAMVAEDTEYLKRADAVQMLSDWAKTVMPDARIVMNVNDQ